MKLTISDRLLACCAYVHPGDRIADIGCDHGYLSIYLLTKGIASSAIASDVNEGPLQSAMRNAKRFGVREKMQFCLSDGVRHIPRNFDTMVCAGMGADTMIHILESAPWLKSASYRLILQCQSKTPMLRAYLNEKGWRILDESVLKDGKFLYTVMEIRYEPDAPRLSDAQCYFPPVLLDHPSPQLSAYWRWVTEGLRISLSHRENPEKQRILKELDALTEEFTFLKEETQ